MDTTPLQPVARTGRSHTIVRTYLSKGGVFSIRKTGIVGGTDKEALHHFNAYVRNGRVNSNLFAVVLVTAAGEKLAAWTRPVEGMVAA